MIVTNYSTHGFIENEQAGSLPLQILDLGLEHRQKESYYFDNQKRPGYKGYLFQYSLEGRGILESEGLSYVLEPGTAFFLKFPNTDRYYLEPEPHKFWKFFYLHFCGPTSDFFFQAIKRKGPGLLSISPHSQTVHRFFEEYLALQAGKKYRPYEGGEFLFSFLSAMLRDSGSEKIEELPLAEKIRSYLQNNYQKQITLGAMCLELETSPAHATRVFKASQGLSPSQYLSQLRLEKALYLVLNTQISITEIARECGYANGNYFAKVFARNLGSSPLEYIKNHRPG